MKGFDLHEPTTVTQAVGLLDQLGATGKVLAGGSDLFEVQFGRAVVAAPGGDNLAKEFLRIVELSLGELQRLAPGAPHYS